MSYETNFNKLKHYRLLANKYHRLYLQRQQVMTEMEGLDSVNIDGLPKGKNKPDYHLEKLIDTKKELDERIQRLNEKLRNERHIIEEALDDMEDDLAACVIEAHYIYNTDLMTISENQGYSLDWIREKNTKGIREICL